MTQPAPTRYVVVLDKPENTRTLHTRRARPWQPPPPNRRPLLSAQSRLTFNLTSALVDGTLSERGFTVTNPRIAQRFGIELGDTITRINGHAVHSSLHARMAFQEFLIRNLLESEVRVFLHRRGIPMTKRYQIR